MSSANTGKPSGSDPEPLAFALPVTPEDVRELDAIRYAHPLPFAQYLDFLTEWSEAWVAAHGQRPPDDGPDRPFEL
jgi:hypothetical protein